MDPQPGLLGAGAPGPSPAPARATADSHLVAGLLVLRGLQVWAGIAHEDVPLAGDRPDGLRGGAAKDPPALAAGQVEQGQLAWADGWSPLGSGWAAGQGWSVLSLLPLDPWPAGPPPTHPVVHVLLGVGSQAHRPPLPGPLRGVQGEGVLGLAEHGNQHCHLSEEHMQVLRTEGGRRGCHQDGQGRPRSPQSHSSQGPGLPVCTVGAGGACGGLVPEQTPGSISEDGKGAGEPD